MAVTCKNCGGAHAIWECKRPATKSMGTVAVRPGRVSQVGSIPTKGNEGSRPSPVDTNSASADNEPHITAGPRAPDTGVAGNHPVSRGPGEENGAPKFDKKAWSRDYMKIWMRNKRAKLKLERENAK